MNFVDHENRTWGLKFIENYNKWKIHQEAKDLKCKKTTITPMFDSTRTIIGFMFSFTNHRYSTARPTLINQNKDYFLNDFRANFFDHWEIQNRYSKNES